MGKIFALVDCNNFFVSCERVFRPDLEGKPVVVLSSNDGCAVARSNEAKKLGIPMGAPAFKFRQVFKDNSVTTFSGNFELYGDISRRITTLLTTVTPHIEVYSIDESFLDLTKLPITDLVGWGRAVRASILKNIGVPVSVGIANSKTLAKLASEIAKQDPAKQGVMSFVGISKPATEAELASMPLREVWGVGRKLAPKLLAEGISNALTLSQLRPQRAQQIMGVHGRQMIAELNGVSCLPLELEHKDTQSILRSRTFGEDTNQAYILEAALATLGAQATFKLRCENLLTKRIGFFANTNRHKPGYTQWSQVVDLQQPTNDSGQIISLLAAELTKVFNPTAQYHRLGVFLEDLAPENSLQTDILGNIDLKQHDKKQARMQALDKINQKHGRGKIHFAAEDLSRNWQPKTKLQSPHYVSNWQELPTAKIKN